MPRKPPVPRPAAPAPSRAPAPGEPAFTVALGRWTWGPYPDLIEARDALRVVRGAAGRPHDGEVRCGHG